MGKPISKVSPEGTRSKTSFLTSPTAVEPQHYMSRIQSILAIKPKIIPSLSTSKYHSINLLHSPNHLGNTPDLRVS